MGAPNAPPASRRARQSAILDAYAETLEEVPANALPHPQQLPAPTSRDSSPAMMREMIPSLATTSQANAAALDVERAAGGMVSEDMESILRNLTKEADKLKGAMQEYQQAEAAANPSQARIAWMQSRRACEELGAWLVHRRQRKLVAVLACAFALLLVSEIAYDAVTPDPPPYPSPSTPRSCQSLGM